MISEKQGSKDTEAIQFSIGGRNKIKLSASDQRLKRVPGPLNSSSIRIAVVRAA